MKIAVKEAMRNVREHSVPGETAILGDRKITAEWTGKYPCLCHGEWIITLDGEIIELPEEVATDSMNTLIGYETWHFGQDWEEIWEHHEDGLLFEPWLKQNSDWIDPLGLTLPEKRKLYDAISKQDWRHGTCGGCI